jgi:WD40 repeat protein
MLDPGSRLGPYEILAPIGAGGMGQVFKARDARLGRDVAIKVCNENFTERFEREARSIAALNHPNICHLYDIGPNYLVLELIDGQPVTEMIRTGPFPLDAALDYARQIADALEAAHERGIIHRDLKPANILITATGVIKVLDFGLATNSEAAASDPEASPTMTISPTRAGMILGTAAYMAPEQARGKKVDKRADIWAFGVVLYEMLTGKHLFEGESVSDILAGVLKEEPNLDAVPARVRRLIRTCLAKDPNKRLRDIGDWTQLLEPERTTEPVAPAPTAAPGKLWLYVIPAAALLLATFVSFLHFREKLPVQQVTRFEIDIPDRGRPLYVALSPDASKLAIVRMNPEGVPQAWIRALDGFEIRPLAGTEDAQYPFWSPDSASLGFFAHGKLKKISVSGGPAQSLCDAPDPRGGAWNGNGVILFSPNPTSPIMRIQAGGGAPSPVTDLASTSASGHRFPAFLPDGVHFLYQASSMKEDASGIYVQSLKEPAKQPKVERLLPGSNTNALYAPPSVSGGSGYLVFRSEGSLMAQSFDLRSLKISGEMLAVAEFVAGTRVSAFGVFSVSDNGVLVYATDRFFQADREMVWFDRAGNRLSVLGKPGGYGEISLSPDDKTAAVTISNGFREEDIWLMDVARGGMSRFTFRHAPIRHVVWSPDGERIAFGVVLSSNAGDIYVKPVSGSTQETLLLHAGLNGRPDDWSADGKWIVFEQQGEKAGRDLWLIPPGGEPKPKPYLQTTFNKQDARISPDGNWMAFVSMESGRPQIYVQPIPAVGAKHQISLAGGHSPNWRRDGKELYYGSPDRKLMAVPFKTGKLFEAGTPEVLFSHAVPRSFGVTKDGQRFLMIDPVVATDSTPSVPPIRVVLNWQAALKKN